MVNENATHGRLATTGLNHSKSGKSIAGQWFAGNGRVDEHGRLVTRTKESHPYSYDGFVQWRGGPNSLVTSTIYSDRLVQFDFDKHDALCMKHFGNKGQYWYGRDPMKIQEFLRDWTNDPELTLVFIMEYCNQASGYPCWRFDFSSKI